MVWVMARIFFCNLPLFIDFFLFSLIFSRTCEANLQHLINLCAVYFPKSATQEILDELLPRLQPLEVDRHCVVLDLLSILGAMPHGHELWVHDFMKLWDTYQNPSWNPEMMSLISAAASQTIGKVDWEPYIPVMFTRILRSMDLPVSYKGYKSGKSPTLYNTSTTSKSIFKIYFI